MIKNTNNTRGIATIKQTIESNRNIIKYADEMITIITEFQTIEKPTKKQINKLLANLFNIIIDDE